MNTYKILIAIIAPLITIPILAYGDHAPPDCESGTTPCYCHATYDDGRTVVGMDVSTCCVNGETRCDATTIKVGSGWFKVNVLTCGCKELSD